MADNMDLYYIVQDFEEYFEIKFQKKPVLVKKNPNAEDELKQAGRVRKPPPSGGMLPKITSASKIDKQSSGQISRQNTATTASASGNAPTPQHKRKGTQLKSSRDSKDNMDFGI